jgi:hypothetical protein
MESKTIYPPLQSVSTRNLPLPAPSGGKIKLRIRAKLNQKPLARINHIHIVAISTLNTEESEN